MNNPVLWKNIFNCCMILSAVFILAIISAFIWKLKKNKHTVYKSDVSDNYIDLIKYPDDQIVYPFVPKILSIIGLLGFFFVFGIGGIIGLSAGLHLMPVIIISLFLGIAGEVAASMIKYAVELQTRSDIIFVPKSIGLVGKVFQDIPAGEEGEGAIRVFMNGAVTHIRAMSVDEVVLAKGTEVKILYASSDTIVVVERLKKTIAE